MTVKSLGVAVLMEGALDVLRRHPVATGVFILANAMAGYAAIWLQGTDVNLALTMLAGIAMASPVASLFTMALGGNLRNMVADPIELVVRLVFAFMASLLIMAGTAIAAIALIIPGLYVGARWTLGPPLVVLGGRGIIESMSESWRLAEETAWPLVGTSVILAVPNIALGIAGLYEPSLFSTELTAQTILQNVAGAGINAFGIAIAVFAYQELSPRTDELVEVFA